MSTNGWSSKQAAAEWRRGFQDHPAFSSDELEELEAHLLEAVDRGIERGEEPAEAFDRATRELGSRSDLLEDYLTAGGPARRLLTLVEDTAMKYLLPASIVFASILLAFTFGRTQTEGPLYQISTDRTGTWRLNTRTGELCRISSEVDYSGNPVYSNNGLQIDVCLLSPELAADPKAARITGRVTLSGGEVPAAGARVHLGDGTATTADRQGRFELVTRNTGPQELAVSLFEAQVSRSLDLEEGKHTSVSLELPDAASGGYSMAGVVVDEVGSVLEGAMVLVDGSQTSTDSSGRFELPLAGPGRYKVRVTSAETTLFRTVTISEPGRNSDTYQLSSK